MPSVPKTVSTTVSTKTPSRQEQTFSRKLMWMNMLVSGSVLLLCCAAFIGYDKLTFRDTTVRNLSTQAQIIGSSSASALLFNDSQQAASALAPLKTAHNILSAAIFTADGRLFASYSRDNTAPPADRKSVV